MAFRSGQSRIVLTFPRLGIVIKLPIIHVFATLRGCRSYIRRRAWRSFFRFWFVYGLDSPSPRRYLFKGLIDNWREFWFWMRRRHPLCQPTYFSLFGFINVQEYGAPCPFTDTDLWCQLVELTEKAVWADSHHFAQVDNFSVHKGRFRMLDYGTPETQGVVLSHGDRIVRDFNIAYDWEERKKQMTREKEGST